MSISTKRQHNLKVGSLGENQAIAFLEEKGYFIWDHNYRHLQDEIDIIAFDPHHQEIVFVEVKTRSSDFSGSPTTAMNRRKLAAQERIASYYIRQNQLTFDYRFDIIAILPHTLEHYCNITWP